MIKRELYLSKIRGFIDQPEVVKVITGLRRSGKSVLLELIQQELLERGTSRDRMLVYNFEDLRFRELRDPEKLHDQIRSRISEGTGRAYLFVDEAQEVEGWETCVNSLRVNSDVDIYITGSNARMLAGEYATLLAGRYIEVRVYPFSFAEFCSALRERSPQLSETELFKQYLWQGGMPFLADNGLDETSSRQYLRDLFASVVIKDVMKRNRFRDVDLLERIVAYVMANIGRIFSATSISKFFKNDKRTVAPETVLNYLKGCEEAYLFSRIKQQDVLGKRILQVNEKYYVVDHGLREAVYGNNERDIELVLENMVCQELLRRGYEITVGRVGSREIDFICKRQKEHIYVQVCYLLASEDTVAREFGGYYEITDNYPKYVVSMDEVDFSRDGIRHMNIRDFLLSSAY